MSKAVSVLGGATYQGEVTITEAGLRGMITLRGDLSDEKLAAAVKSVVGLALPETRAIKEGKQGAVAWMSPDELLLLCEYQHADALVAKLDAALAGAHFLAINVSDARAMFTLSGAGVREVIAKGAPVDLSRRSFKLGEIRRSRIGQIAAAFWLSDEETLSVICFRSVGAHLFDWLKNAAEHGSLPRFL
ncbi:MAG: sarcosine oxidase subunit gamma [Alphaproteobacteria bacterium]|nr:sarcosine oxidase subunit gamma [Alphaproteobacteria bacterium]